MEYLLRDILMSFSRLESKGMQKRMVSIGERINASFTKTVQLVLVRLRIWREELCLVKGP